MEYPYVHNFNVKNIYGEQPVQITIYSGLTVFVGPNASGKTQTLKALRTSLKKVFGSEKVRYLSSNRIGTMETYRSRVGQYAYSPDDYIVGDRNNKKSRKEIEIAAGDFFTMDEKKDIYIKVAERLSVLFGRQIYLRWDAGKLKVYFEKTDSQEEYSVAVEASGLVNVISILAALFDKDVEVLLIDEPEVSLHPQLQSYLLREMKKAAREYKKTIIISTHSTEMISLSNISDMSNLVFFSDKKLPVQVSPTAPELENRKLKDFVMRMGQIYKAGFFAKKILLIEGASDLIISKCLLQKLDLNIDVAGSQIVPVEGKGQFPVITKMFRLVNKEVCILTDLDGFTDDNKVTELFSTSPEADEIARSNSHRSMAEMIQNVRDEMTKLVDANQDRLAPIYESHPYWSNRKPSDDATKAIRRAVIAQLLSSSQESLAQWPDADVWCSMQISLDNLLSSLEKIGCFVLRKGAIESYYQFAPSTTYDEKPTKAVEETSNLQDQSEAYIREKYGDIIRALEFVALTKKVDESFAVKKELLSELALVIGMLPRISDTKELYAAIKQARGNNDSLFTYDPINENGRLGVNVSIKSEIIDVSGFPFRIFCGDNVNDVVERTICCSLA
jgi:energy-coupling factor transporter ATP-binding protein EcfA2